MKNTLIITCIFLLLILPVSNSIFAQVPENRELVDSLSTALSQQKEDTTKVAILNKLSFVFSDINPDSGLIYARKALALAKRSRWDIGIATAYYQTGINLNEQGMFDTAEQYFKKGLKIYVEKNDKRGIANSYNALGTMYFFQGNYVKTRESFDEALKCYTELQDSVRMTAVMQNLGSIYFETGDPEKALEYVKRGYAIDKARNNKIGVAVTLINLGMGYSSLGRYDSALIFFDEALGLYKELGHDKSVARVYMNVGVVYNRIGKYREAIDNYNRSLGICQKIKDSIGIADNLLNLAMVYTQTGRDNEAISATTRALNIYTDLGMIDGMMYCQSELSKAYSHNRQYKQSLEAYKQFTDLKDSLYNKENTEKIAKLEVKAQYDAKQIADSIKNAEAQHISQLKLQRQKTFTYSGIGIAVLLLFFSIYIYRNNKKLNAEKKKSESLLHNILPEEVTEELKQRGATTAHQFDHVTVIFTDFVAFTQAGARMGSKALVEELHNCFKAFDDIMERYGIEKIKTIGDAYLAVCGLPVADSRHAEKVVRAAKDILAFMVQRREQLGDRTFEIRIGIHSGEVVAGIVGIKKFAYDIWGDTVNTAARMEQNSEPGKINISHTTYELVKDKIDCTYRGELEAKGKGMLEMYFVES
ncbi:MAG: tetratricopeptide repeat protein [Chitinophagales bacterium]|nr:tetratricopeptide repeat protein [Chitinophagales bacterium]